MAPLQWIPNKVHDNTEESNDRYTEHQEVTICKRMDKPGVPEIQPTNANLVNVTVPRIKTRTAMPELSKSSNKGVSNKKIDERKVPDKTRRITVPVGITNTKMKRRAPLPPKPPRRASLSIAKSVPASLQRKQSVHLSEWDRHLIAKRVETIETNVVNELLSILKTDPLTVPHALRLAGKYQSALPQDYYPHQELGGKPPKNEAPKSGWTPKYPVPKCDRPPKNLVPEPFELNEDLEEYMSDEARSTKIPNTTTRHKKARDEQEVVQKKKYIINGKIINIYEAEERNADEGIREASHGDRYQVDDFENIADFDDLEPWPTRRQSNQPQVTTSEARFRETQRRETSKPRHVDEGNGMDTRTLRQSEVYNPNDSPELLDEQNYLRANVKPPSYKAYLDGDMNCDYKSNDREANRDIRNLLQFDNMIMAEEIMSADILADVLDINPMPIGGGDGNDGKHQSNMSDEDDDVKKIDKLLASAADARGSLTDIQRLEQYIRSL